MSNLYNSKEKIDDNQIIYDNFNSFIFSQDRNVFNKLLSRFSFYKMTQYLHGDIVECGVFKGSGLLTWLKILDMHEPNSLKKVIGFDFFGSNFLGNLRSDVDRETMRQVFDRDANLKDSDISIEGIKEKIQKANFRNDRYDLIEGDVSITTREYVKDKPGFRISILYLDVDLDEPTYDSLCNLWEKIVPGGVVVFDEYAYHSWSESNGVDRFLEKIKRPLHNTNIKAPTAYIIK